jgi:lipid II isoglutaminyl synthase (glutamine-hydrolysing)
VSVPIYITHLYPKEMSIYGDLGNILAMKYRLKEYGFDVIYQTVGLGQDLPTKTDWYFMGGGQDKEQEMIFRDLYEKRKNLILDIENGVGLLAICGGYQLFGQSFLTGNGIEAKGIGVFDVITKAPSDAVKDRCIGNIISECLIQDLKGEKLIGFENHGGQTEFNYSKIDPESQFKKTQKNAAFFGGLLGSGLGVGESIGGVIGRNNDPFRKKHLEKTFIPDFNGQKCKPLGKVMIGKGNNSMGIYEGCVYKNAVGTYLHGSCLPKNPALCDWFIKKILERKHLTLPNHLNDQIEEAVRNNLIERYLV